MGRRFCESVAAVVSVLGLGCSAADSSSGTPPATSTPCQVSQQCGRGQTCDAKACTGTLPPKGSAPGHWESEVLFGVGMGVPFPALGRRAQLVYESGGPVVVMSIPPGPKDAEQLQSLNFDGRDSLVVRVEAGKVTTIPVPSLYGSAFSSGAETFLWSEAKRELRRGGAETIFKGTKSDPPAPFGSGPDALAPGGEFIALPREGLLRKVGTAWAAESFPGAGSLAGIGDVLYRSGKFEYIWHSVPGTTAYGSIGSTMGAFPSGAGTYSNFVVNRSGQDPVASVVVWEKVSDEVARLTAVSLPGHETVDCGSVSQMGVPGDFSLGGGPEVVPTSPRVLAVELASDCPNANGDQYGNRKTEFRQLPYSGTPLAVVDQCDARTVLGQKWVTFSGRDVSRVALVMEKGGAVRVVIDEYYVLPLAFRRGA